MLDLTRKLCSLPGVSSREEAVREFIAQTIRPYVKWMKVDAMGNLIAFKEGKKHTGSKLLLDAHMDEVGVMVTGYTEQGCLRFAFVGGVDRRVVIGKRVYLGKERILGVFGMKPIHQTTKEERTAVPKVEELYIDIGAKDKAEAQTKVKLGEVGVFDGETLLFGDGFLKGKAIDDRAGCAAMMKLAQEELPMDVTFVFSTQEEVGTRGAFASAFSVKPEIALVLGLAAGTWVLLSVLGSLEAVASLMEELSQLAGLDRAVVEPVFKTVALSILTKLTSEVCRAAGEGGIAAAVETAGTVLALAVALPLARGVLELMKEMLL